MEAGGSGPLPRVPPRDGNNGDGLVLTPAGIGESWRRKTSPADIIVVTERDLVPALGRRAAFGFSQEGLAARVLNTGGSGPQISPPAPSRVTVARYEKRQTHRPQRVPVGCCGQGPPWREGRERKERGFDGWHLRAPGRMWAAHLHLPLISLK